MSTNKPVSSAAALSNTSLPHADDDAWTTIATFGDAGEAEVTRGLLENAEIPVRITDAHSASMLGVPSLALGGVGVQVAQKDVPRARAVLKETQKAAGGLVFRVVNHELVSMAIKVFAVSAVAAFVAANVGMLGQNRVATVMIAGAVVGAVIGRARTFFLCSNLQCSARLTTEMKTCPGCGGEIAGEIASLNERLEAEERVKAERKAQPAIDASA